MTSSRRDLRSVSSNSAIFSKSPVSGPPKRLSGEADERCRGCTPRHTGQHLRYRSGVGPSLCEGPGKMVIFVRARLVSPCIIAGGNLRMYGGLYLANGQNRNSRVKYQMSRLISYSHVTNEVSCRVSKLNMPSSDEVD